MSKKETETIAPARLRAMVAVLVVWALDIVAAVTSSFIAQLTDHSGVVWQVHWEVGAICAGMLLALNWWKAPMFGVKWFKNGNE